MKSVGRVAKANICHREEEMEENCNNRLCLVRIVQLSLFCLISVCTGY